MLTMRLLLLFLAICAPVCCQEPPASAPLNVKRNYIINLANGIRLRQYQTLAPLYQDVTLNGLAQFHSEDMAKRNFVGHYNPDGRSPEQRAAAAGFTYEIEENVGKGSSLSSTFVSIMGDAAQYANIIDKKWTRAGVGIAIKNSSSYLTMVFSTRDFSQFPLTQSQQSGLESKIKDEIIPLILNTTLQMQELSTYITIWVNDGRRAEIFKYLASINYEIDPRSVYYRIEAPWSVDLDEIGRYLQPLRAGPSYTKYGIGYEIGGDGRIAVNIIYVP